MSQIRARATITVRQSPTVMTRTQLTLAFVLCWSVAQGFLVSPPAGRHPQTITTTKQRQHSPVILTQSPPQSTALNVWWFGGTETETAELTEQDSCELVAVRIERTSANSRRIYGEIVAPVPIQDVWAILTDYNRLSVHVPNLVESRMVTQGPGQPGDGQFTCRLYQKGAQKIIGFEFGASVTMDMRESRSKSVVGGEERRISFKCYDSFFFNIFDGYWNVKEQKGDMGQVETLLSYVVDVRPKGPVPVAPLEWRIREDVPTNLRAVKKAAIEQGYQGVMAARRPSVVIAQSGQRLRQNGKRLRQKGSPAKLSRINVNWEREETMATYLNLKPDQQ